MKKGEIVKIESNLWEFDSETGTIIKCLASLSTNVIIPELINNIPVKIIEQSAFTDCSELTTITIPKSVTNIGKYSFGGCKSLKSITINKPNGSITDSPWSAINAKITWTK